jgi:hypothetical protein
MAVTGGFGRVLADQRPKRRLVPDRIEIGVRACIRAELLRRADRPSQVINRVGRSAAQALTAGQVLDEHPILRIRLRERHHEPWPPSCHARLRLGLSSSPLSAVLNHGEHRDDEVEYR